LAINSFLSIADSDFLINNSFSKIPFNRSFAMQPVDRRLALIFMFILLFAFASACTNQTQETLKATPEANPVEQKIKERGELMTKELSRQKELKAVIQEMPLIEEFKRETTEKEVLEKLGEPERIVNMKMEKTDQKIYYYKSAKFAVWFWREKENEGPFQYRATMSLSHGKFDMPLHNVLEQDELRRLQVSMN
jgi:hypothetical protein